MSNLSGRDKAIRMLRRAQSDLDMAHSEACYALAYFDAVHADKTADADSRLAAMSLRAESLEYCGSIRETMNKLPSAAIVQKLEVRSQPEELPPMRTAASMLRKHREGVVAASVRHGHPIVALVGCLLLCALPMAVNAGEVGDVAWTLYAEARGEGAKGLQAVATVIANRSAERGLSPAQVVRQPYQFECWNGRRIAGTGHGPTWAQCRNLAARICDGTFQAAEDWNHFFNPRKASPRWALAMNDRTRIGAHVFGTIN